MMRTADAETFVPPPHFVPPSACDSPCMHREVGSTCMLTTMKAHGDGGTADTTRSYQVTLLKDPNKSLAEALPGIKVGPKRK